MVRELSARELAAMVDRGESFGVVDTRDEESFESFRIDGSVHYRWAPGMAFDVEEFRAATGLGRDDAVVTVCAKGVSSYVLAQKLDAAGYGDVSALDGGLRAWSRLYEHVPLPLDGPEVVQLQRRAKGCLSYLVGDPATGEAAVVDPGRDTDEYLRAAARRSYRITRVFDTHVHADHVSGGRDLADRTGASYHLPAGAADRGVAYDFVPVEDGETLPVGDLDVSGLSTPGHTSEMTAYLLDGAAVCTADTLFVDGVGRTELEFGDEGAEEGARLLYESLHEVLLDLPDDVAVLPGHFDVADDGTTGVTVGEPVWTTVGGVGDLEVLELDEAAFVERVTGRAGDTPPNYERVIAANTGRESLYDIEAVDLELGPNRCAAG